MFSTHKTYLSILILLMSGYLQSPGYPTPISNTELSSHIVGIPLPENWSLTFEMEKLELEQYRAWLDVVSVFCYKLNVIDRIVQVYKITLHSLIIIDGYLEVCLIAFTTYHHLISFYPLINMLLKVTCTWNALQ